ncbi:MAG: hypothetical protein U0797_26165 [Gemmataceae bacterium]
MGCASAWPAWPPRTRACPRLGTKAAGLAEHVEVVTDARYRWRRARPRLGLDVVAGTGRSPGVDRPTAARRSGGWGYLLHDEGSGHAVAMQAPWVVVETAPPTGSAWRRH